LGPDDDVCSAHDEQPDESNTDSLSSITITTEEESVFTTEEEPVPPSAPKFVNDLPTGTGLGPEADVWPVYNEQADKFDKEMVETFNGGTDNLLIFAALFSAVVTAFLVLPLPLLQADPTQATLDALTTISAQIAAQNDVGHTPTPPYQGGDTSPTPSAVSINALWILSLFLSLSTLVLAMLVK